MTRGLAPAPPSPSPTGEGVRCGSGTHARCPFSPRETATAGTAANAAGGPPGAAQGCGASDGAQRRMRVRDSACAALPRAVLKARPGMAGPDVRRMDACLPQSVVQNPVRPSRMRCFSTARRRRDENSCRSTASRPRAPQERCMPTQISTRGSACAGTTSGMWSRRRRASSRRAVRSFWSVNTK